MADKKPRKKKEKPVEAPVSVAEVQEQVADDGPKPIAYPDFFLTETLRHNPNLLIYQNKVLDDTTSGYIRHGLRKFYMAKGIDRHEMSFNQKDLEQALVDGFKV